MYLYLIDWFDSFQFKPVVLNVFFNIFFDPVWSVIIEAEEVDHEENVDNGEIKPKECGPYYLQVVRVENTFGPRDSFNFESGVKETEELDGNRHSHDKADGISSIHYVQNFDSELWKVFTNIEK